MPVHFVSLEVTEEERKLLHRAAIAHMTAIKKLSEKMALLGVDRTEVDEVLLTLNGDGALFPGLLSRIAKLAPDAQQSLATEEPIAVADPAFVAEPLALVPSGDIEIDEKEDAPAETEEEA